MKHLSSKMVRDAQMKKNQRHYEAFDHILTGIYKHIEKCISMFRTATYCVYTVPEFVLGYPLYNLNECIGYIQDKLKKNGYSTKYVFPNILFISWGGAKKQLTFQLPPKVN